MPDLSDADRQRLALTFDSAADLYDRARPDYPEALFDDLVTATGLTRASRLLEVGSATGKATLPLVRRGFDVTCIEPGHDLARIARQNLSGYGVRVIESRFEEWQPRHGEVFDLVFAATAWNWIDPAVRYVKAASVLRPNGHLAFWNAGQVFPAEGDPFFVEIQDVYEAIGEGLPPDASWPRPGELVEERDGVEASGLFDIVLIRHFDWERAYTADEYIGLLDTFSGHIAMEPGKRAHLDEEIRTRVSSRPDPLVRRHWGAVLHVARRR